MRALVVLAMLGLVGCATPPNQPALTSVPPPGPSTLPLAGMPAHPELSARDIIERATAAAGGETWRRPKTLTLRGYGIFYEGGDAHINERHEMWRVYPDFKPNAHAADGKVRIDSYRDGKIRSQVAFDGTTTWTHNGIQPPSAADQQWAENFGFGVIRYAMEDGYRLQRLMDELVDGQPCHLIKVIDPGAVETLFCVRTNDFAIVKVGFSTPRGWHERIYSQFYRKPGVDWVQPGRVRLLYNGVKQNEVIWTDFDVNNPIPDSLFSYSGAMK